jgi:predicted TIM-barrel fold metal-dependent hydrolase
VLSHCWLGNFQMSNVEKAVKERPGLKLIMAHQGGGYAEATDEFTTLMKDYPNLYMEICGSLYNTYSVEDFVRLAGEDRVIYGSDLLGCDAGFELGRVTLSTLPDNIMRKILAENFLNLLKDSSMGKIDVSLVV